MDAGDELETLLNIPGSLYPAPGAPGTILTMPDETIRSEPNVLSEAPHLGFGSELVRLLGLLPTSQTHEIH